MAKTSMFGGEAGLTLGLGLVMAQAVMLQMVVVVLRMATSYQAISLGLGAFELGAVSACFAILPLVLAVPVGRAIDARGQIIALWGGTASLVMAAAAFAGIGQTVAGLVLGTMLLGLAHFLTVIGHQALVGSIGSAKSRDRQFGWYTAAISLGQILGPGLVALLSRGAVPNQLSIFQICLGLALVQVMLLWRIRAILPPPTARQTRKIWPIGLLLRLRGVRLVVVCGIVVAAAFDLIVIYLPLLGASRGIEAATIAGLLLVRSLFSLASRLVYGPLSRRFSPSMLLGATMLTAGISLLVLAVPISLPAMTIAIAVGGFGLGIALPITLSWLSDIAPPTGRGMLFSLRQSSIRTSQLFFPLAAGGLAAVAGTGTIFVLLAFFLALAGSAAFRLRR